MFFALFAYFRVFKVSIKSLSDGETHAIMSVRLEKKKVSSYTQDILPKIILQFTCVKEIVLHALT